MRISDWSSDVCSSDLNQAGGKPHAPPATARHRRGTEGAHPRCRGDRARRRGGVRAPAPAGRAARRLLDLTLFRDDRLVALHDLVEACRSSARHCLLAAESMPNDPRCEELRALGEKRTANADFFGARMIAEDDIPGSTPEERSLVRSEEHKSELQSLM